VSIRTRTIVPTLVVVGLLIAGYQVLGPRSNGTKDKNDDGMVLVTGTWEPSPRRDGVQVVVTVAGSAKVDKTENVAPFNRSYPAKRGDTVSITLTFKSGLTNQGRRDVLACSIKWKGIEQIYDYNTRAGINEPLRCEVVLT
jgi:hypothetical protein